MKTLQQAAWNFPHKEFYLILDSLANPAAPASRYYR